MQKNNGSSLPSTLSTPLTLSHLNHKQTCPPFPLWCKMCWILITGHAKRKKIEDQRTRWKWPKSWSSLRVPCGTHKNPWKDLDFLLQNADHFLLGLCIWIFDCFSVFQIHEGRIATHQFSFDLKIIACCTDCFTQIQHQKLDLYPELNSLIRSLLPV